MSNVVSINRSHENVEVKNRALVMSTNVGRDIKSRSYDFRNFETAVFEYIANAYEAYNVGETPEINIQIKNGKNGSISISDHGIGMSYDSDLPRFWTMHANTVRREGGLNRRGYHGTGKSAFYGIANSIIVDTIKNGLRSRTRLTAEAIENAAKSDNGEPLYIETMIANGETDSRNGTTIIINNMKKPITDADVRSLRQKVENESLMWLAGANIYINDIKVEAPAVNYDIIEEEKSEHGHFSATLMYLDSGYPENIDKIFISVDNVFIAREDFGKEGSRYSKKIHVRINTDSVWANENFHNYRERFVSESRDLKMKRLDPAAAELVEFIEFVVRKFVSKIEVIEAEKRKNDIDKTLRDMETRLSKIFSADYSLGGGANKHWSNNKRIEKEIKEPNHKVSKGRSNKIRFEFSSFDPEMIYRFEEGNVIQINLDHSHVKTLRQNGLDNVTDKITLDIATIAYSDLVSTRVIEKEIEECVLNREDIAAILARKHNVTCLTVSRMKNTLTDFYLED